MCGMSKLTDAVRASNESVEEKLEFALEYIDRLHEMFGVNKTIDDDIEEDERMRNE